MDEKTNILKNNYFLNKRKDVRKKDKFASDKLITFVLSFIVSLIIIIALYLISPYSKTYQVTVDGNIYLKDEDIIECANLNKYYLLTLPGVKEKTLLKSPYIEEAQIQMLNDNVVNIKVKEVKQVGYLYEDNGAKLLLANNERVTLDKNNMYLINKVPLIEGYNKDELKKVTRGFDEVEPDIINEISEIHKYPVSYDVEQMEVIMRDGNYCFLSSSGLKLLKNYYSITSSIDKSKGHVCVYLDDFTNTAYMSACPWQVKESIGS